MDDTWGTPNQTPEPPVRLCAAHLYLIAATVTATVTLLLYYVDYTSAWDLHRGAYPLLVAAIVLFGCAWIVRAAESRAARSRAAQLEQMEERINGRLAELTSTVRQLRDEVARQRTYLPARGRHTAGHTYRSVTAGQDATVPLPSPAAVEAMREQVREIVAEEVQERRAQIYAEGYVDGVARRQEGPGAT